MYFVLVLIHYMLFSTKPKLLKGFKGELGIQNGQIFLYRECAGLFHKYRILLYNCAFFCLHEYFQLCYM